jgi:hypothetical protein
VKLAICLLALAALAPRASAGDVPVGWKDKEASTAQLPAGLPPPAFDAITRWVGWAQKAGYRMDLDAQGRVLLLTPAKSSRGRDMLRVVGRAETWFDGVLPPPPRAAAPAGASTQPDGAPAKPTPPPLPEDPEGPPPGARPPKPGGTSTGAPAAATTWGSGSVAPDSQTAVLIVLAGMEDHAALLDHLESSVRYLREWVATARKHTGLTLEEPLLGAYVENAPGQEEWNGDHELYNRTVQILTLRRFGQLPNWLVQGIAWEGEMAFDGSLYCFPYRAGFVAVTEHTGWPSDLRIAFKDRATRPVQIEELARWARGTWDPEAARVAWGVVHHLVEAQKAKPGALSALLEGLRLVRDELDRRPTGASTWERVPDWSMPAATQEHLLVQHFGKDVLRKATQSIRGLKDPAPATESRAAKGRDAARKD